MYAFERAILEIVKGRLGREAGILLDRQLDSVADVKRESKGKEVMLYHRPRFDDAISFADKSEQTMLASMVLESVPSGKICKVEVWIVRGRVFSLIFTEPPAPLFISKFRKRLTAAAREVRIWLDPMVPEAEADAELRISEAAAWIRQWHDEGVLSDLQPPLSIRMRSTLLEQIEAVLPQDYLELVSSSRGAKVDKCTIFGLKEIRELVFPTDFYYMLAEVEGKGALAVRRDALDGTIYYFDFEGSGEKVEMGTSIKAAVEELLAL